MGRTGWIVGVAGLAAIVGSPLVAQTPRAPAAVVAKMSQLDTACVRAGGRPVAKPYVHVHDVTGDGRPDYLLSEGDYECAGRPGIFQTDGQAFIEIYVTDAAGGARRTYRQRVRAYRVVNSTPRTIQIALTAPACADGKALCGLTLAYQPQTGGFTGVPVEPQQTQASPSAPPAAAPAEDGPPTPRAGETQAAFGARCQREMIAAEPKSRAWAADSCQQTWARATAAGPAADLLIALAKARSAGALGVPQIKAATQNIRWSAKPGAAGLQSGALGRLEAILDPKEGTVSLGWSATGQMSPYDVPGALAVRGVALSQIGCQNYGQSEVTRVYRMTVEGAPPLALTVYDRSAPTANAFSFYNSALDVVRPPPTLAALRARAPGDNWSQRCVFR